MPKITRADVRLAVAKLVSTDVHHATPIMTAPSTSSGTNRSSTVPSMRRRNQSEIGTTFSAIAPIAAAAATRPSRTTRRNAWLPRDPVRQPSTRWWTYVEIPRTRVPHAFDTGEAKSEARGWSDTILIALGGVGAAWLARVSERLLGEERKAES